MSQELAGNIGALGGTLVATMSKPARAYRHGLKDDIARLQHGDLGLSEAERRAILLNARKEADKAQQRQNAQLAVMMRTDPSMRMKALQAQGDVAKSGALAQSQAAAQADIFSAQLAEQRRQAILDRLERTTQRYHGQGQKYGRQAGETAYQAVQLAGPAMGGGDAAAAGAALGKMS